MALIKRDVTVLTANGDNLTDTSDPSRIMMRQIAGSFSQYEKARLVSKLKAARDRKREATGKCGGRKSVAELYPAAIELAKQLRRKRPKGGQRSFREISAELAAVGHVNKKGRPFSASAVRTMIEA